jgi:ribonuclease H / adenosylcobalamin/alpha-ribazole phosphatase
MIKREAFQNTILKTLYGIEGVVSVTLVGSFAEGVGNEGFSDIDTVVICKNLDETLFKKCLKACENLENIIDKKLYINSTFGPLKFDAEDNVVIHLMVYDLFSHIKHVHRSPFTCYDWERSNKYLGVKLGEICTVGTLLFDDFKKSRRGFAEYEAELEKDTLSYREYEWQNSLPTEIVKYQPLDDRGKAEFIFHIVKNLIYNFFKLISGKNKIPNTIEVKTVINKIVPNDLDFFDQFEELMILKKCNQLEYTASIKKWALIFISSFEDYLKKEESSIVNVIFIRHAKTSKNDGRFLGVYSNPSILKYDYKINMKFDIIFTSPLKRAIQTALLLKNKEQIISDSSLLEINYGDADGMEILEFSKKYPNIVDAWSKKLDPKFPSGENYANVLSRIDDFSVTLAAYTKDNINDKSIGVITHNVLLRCLIGTKMKLPNHLWHLIDIPHCSQLHFHIWQGKLVSSMDRAYLVDLHLRNVVSLQ